MSRFVRWLRSWHRYLFIERMGYRRPSHMTVEELAFRERAVTKLDELETFVRVCDAKVEVLRIGRDR